jgi:hypothetical protein
MGKGEVCQYVADLLKVAARRFAGRVRRLSTHYGVTTDLGVRDPGISKWPYRQVDVTGLHGSGGRAAPILRIATNTAGVDWKLAWIGWLCRVMAYGKLMMMIGINEIEDAVLRLTPAELDAFRTWFAEFDGAAWDRQMEDDVAAGRLDALAEEALEDLRAGRCTDR